MFRKSTVGRKTYKLLVVITLLIFLILTTNLLVAVRENICVVKRPIATDILPSNTAKRIQQAEQVTQGETLGYHKKFDHLATTSRLYSTTGKKKTYDTLISLNDTLRIMPTEKAFENLRQLIFGRKEEPYQKSIIDRAENDKLKTKLDQHTAQKGSLGHIQKYDREHHQVHKISSKVAAQYPRPVLLVSSWRSGSSFLGELLALAYNDIFYK